mmetsp:Transcript_67152/g.216634  ORF Transcript_67152/g.216634 Transcript_67152/m.216634 type:complete len:571 (+) Transcript_67152:77-1789(+)
MAEPKDPKIKAIYDTLQYDVTKAMKLAEDAAKGGDKAVAADATSAKASVFLAQGKTDEAMKAAEEAVSMAKASGSKSCEGNALNAIAMVLVAQSELAKATEKASEALVVFKDLKDSESQTDVYRTMISAKLVDGKKPEARQVAEDAIEAFKAAGDTKGQASAQLLLSEACMSTLKNSDAAAAAKEALKLYKAMPDKEGEAAALLAIVSAELNDEMGGAVSAAAERASIFREMGKSLEEAGALVLLAQAHVTRIGLKLATCSIASAEDTMGALKAAKDGYALYAELGERDGMGSAMDLMYRVMMYNGVPGSVIDTISDPEELFQDVMSGKYSTPSNAFPPRPVSKQLKVEEIIPTSKQLDRGKFSWNSPAGGYSYTLIWQAVKDRNMVNKKPRGSYDILALNIGAKTTAVSTAFTAMSNDAADRNTPMVVYMSSHNCSQSYGANIMSQTSTMASMIVARLSRLTVVQFNEGHYDWTNTSARLVNFYPVTLALLRSCRIEAPTVGIGFVAGDAATWMADPAPLIENLFDTLESDECEIMYKRGEAFAPLIVHRPMEDGVQYVKAKKKNMFGM